MGFGIFSPSIWSDSTFGSFPRQTWRYLPSEFPAIVIFPISVDRIVSHRIGINRLVQTLRRTHFFNGCNSARPADYLCDIG